MAKDPSMSTNLMTWDPRYLIKHYPTHVAIKPWNMTSMTEKLSFFIYFHFNFKLMIDSIIGKKIKYV